MFPSVLSSKSSGDPLSIPGLVMWLRGGVGLWQDTSGTIAAVNNGDPVARWDDASGLGNNVLQTTAGFRPTISTSVTQNGYNSIASDGVNDRMATAGSVTVGNNATLFVVYTGPSAGTADSVLQDPSGNTLVWHRSASGKYGWYTAGVNRNTTTDGTSGNRIVCWAYDSASLVGLVYLNGSQTGGNVTVPSQSWTMTINCAGGGLSGYMQANFFEYVYYNSVLSQSDRDMIFAYLNAKYAIY